MYVVPVLRRVYIMVSHIAKGERWEGYVCWLTDIENILTGESPSLPCQVINILYIVIIRHGSVSNIVLLG